MVSGLLKTARNMSPARSVYTKTYRLDGNPALCHSQRDQIRVIDAVPHIAIHRLCVECHQWISMATKPVGEQANQGPNRSQPYISFRHVQHTDKSKCGGMCLTRRFGRTRATKKSLGSVTGSGSLCKDRNGRNGTD
jgi:hypothetical protein